MRDQQNEEHHEEDKKEDLGDPRRRSGYSGKSEDGGDDRHDKEEQCPVQELHFKSLLARGPGTTMMPTRSSAM
jgi:hypothetical protein